MNIITVTTKNFHTIVSEYIENKNIKICDIDSMIETYMSMVEEYHLFMIDRDLLKDLLVDLTYMYAPKDDANKSRALYHLVGSDSDSDDNDDDNSDMLNNMKNMMSSISSMPGMPNMSSMPNMPNIPNKPDTPATPDTGEQSPENVD